MLMAIVTLKGILKERKEPPRSVTRPPKVNRTFEDECSKGGENVISSIFVRRTNCKLRWGPHIEIFFGTCEKLYESYM